MKRSRKVRSSDVRRAQYELPGFAAGNCAAHLDLILTLIGAFQTRYGRNAIVESIEQHVREARQDITNWQHYAQCVTHYDAAHQAVREEYE